MNEAASCVLLNETYWCNIFCLACRSLHLNASFLNTYVLLTWSTQQQDTVIETAGRITMSQIAT